MRLAHANERGALHPNVVHQQIGHGGAVLLQTLRQNTRNIGIDDMGAVGMGVTLKIMEGELQAARDALASGDILKMMPAYQSLKEYSDDD